MSNKEVINQLKSLKPHCESMKESGEEWEKDVQALECGIEELEKTAQEVPVQEQSISSSLKINLKINGSEVFKDMNPEDSLIINTKSTGISSIEINLLKA